MNSEVSINSFISNIADIILSKCEALYQIDHRTDSYVALKSSPFLDSVLGLRGSYIQLFKTLYLNQRNIKSNAYLSFVEKGRPIQNIYTRKIRMRSEKKTPDMNMIYFPGKTPDTAYLLLSPIEDTLVSKDMRDASREVLSGDYLYTMLVDLDLDECYNPHVSEISLADQDQLNLLFSEWRTTLSHCVLPNTESFFLEKTDPSFIRQHLEVEKRFSFEIQMQNLKGIYIWARHSLLRIRNDDNDHLIFSYIVEDIDLEKKALFHTFKTAARLDDPSAAAGIPSLSGADINIPDDSYAGDQGQVSRVNELSGHDTEESPNISSLSSVILSQVEAEIREHYMEKLSLNAMAHKYFINSAYLGQLFIRRYKMTFHEYLTARRMEHAADMLVNTNYSVRQVMDMIGISSPHYFNRLFREYYGCTATAFRKPRR